MPMIFAIISRKAILIYFWIIILVIISMGCSQKVDPSFEQGKKIYENYCVSCHGSNGEGVLYKKSVLNNSSLVLGEPDKVIIVILCGMERAGTMPGWKETLNDQEVAAVATYVRQAWSNRADAISPALVSELRNKGEKMSSTNPLPLR